MDFETQLGSLSSQIAPLPANRWVEATDTARAAEWLARDGFVVVRNFLDRDAVLRQTAAITVDLERYMLRVREFRSAEYADFIINCRKERFATYRQIAAAPKPVFNVRNNRGEDAPDAGLVDLFHADRLLPALLPIRMSLADGFPARILSCLPMFSGGPSHVARQCNLYINEGVSYTRGFHVDADIPNIKAFLYLTDVLRFDDGPYCYVPGSHREALIKSLNRRYNSCVGHGQTDMFLTDPADAVAFLAPAGTLILTYQSGIHRGYPQAPDGRRLALVQLFAPVL